VRGVDDETQRTVIGPAIGGAVTRNDAHTHVAAGADNDVERTFDGIGRLVVIDDARRAGKECLGRSECRRPVEDVEVESGIETPPDVTQHHGKR